MYDVLMFDMLQLVDETHNTQSFDLAGRVGTLRDFQS